MAAIDIFNDAAFSTFELSDKVSKMPYVPGRIGEMGIFSMDGIRTTDLAVEEHNGVLSLIPYSERNGPDNIVASAKRRILKFSCGHFPLRRVIRPDEIQNIRAFGEEDELESAESVVADKMAEMVPYHDATLEYQMLGALKGYLVDADGSTVIEDLYARFNITQKTTAFALGTDTTKVRQKCMATLRLIEDGLGGATYTGVRAICGAGFFDKLISHPDVQEAYERWQENGQQGAFLRSDPRYKGFEFGGIHWEEYRGKVNSISFMADQECQIFPVGVPDMYVVRFAPANMMEFANTKGLPRYASMERLPHGRGMDVLTESDPISLNKRPEAVVKGTTN